MTVSSLLDRLPADAPATFPAAPTPTDEGPHYGVKVGDFFYSSWGYDQTNVDWFMVVGLTAKSVKIIKVKGRYTDDDGGPITHLVPTTEPDLPEVLNATCECSPGERVRVRKIRAPWLGSFTGTVCLKKSAWVCYHCNSIVEVDEPTPEVMTKRLKNYGRPGSPSISAAWRSYASLHLWDGSPKYQTGSGWGH